MFWIGLTVGLYFGFGSFLVLQAVCEVKSNWRMIYRVPVILVGWPALFIVAFTDK